MTRILLITSLFALHLTSCRQDISVPVDKSSILLIDNQVDKIIEEIGTFKSHIIYTADTSDITSLKKLKDTFNKIRGDYKSNQDNKTTVERVKGLYKEYGYKYNFITNRLMNDIDSLDYSTDKELKLAINELCLMSRVSNAMMKCHAVFNRYRTECIKAGDNEYNVYLIPMLNQNNSAVLFGDFDFETSTLMPESDSNIVVKNIGDHYYIKNNNPKTKHGYIRIKRPDGAFEQFPFIMN